MDDGIIPGSSQYKEAAKHSLMKIEFLEGGRLKDRTIAVVIVSMPLNWCYAIAPVTKFRKWESNSKIIVRACLPNGSKKTIRPNDLVVTADFAKFYLYDKNVEFNEMDIANVPPARNETIYLFCYDNVGEILQAGNVTLTGEDDLKHDCPSPDPVKIRNINQTEITILLSGEVLLDDFGMLVGIVSEIHPNDRTAAVNVTAIRRQLMNNNESIAEFKERIMKNANPPPRNG